MSTSDLKVGDVISIDFELDGEIDHTVIIVEAGTTDSSKYLASHTSDRYRHYYRNDQLQDFTIEYLSQNLWGIYGFEIDTVFE